MENKANVPTDEQLLELIKNNEIKNEIYKGMLQLNTDGRIKIMEYLKDIGEIKEYQRQKTDIELLI